MNGTTAIVLVAILCISGQSFVHYRSIAGIAETLAGVIRDSYAPAELPESRPTSAELGVTDEVVYGYPPQIVDPTEVEFPTPRFPESHLIPAGMTSQQFLGIASPDEGPIVPNPTEFTGHDLSGELT